MAEREDRVKARYGGVKKDPIQAKPDKAPAEVSKTQPTVPDKPVAQQSAEANAEGAAAAGAPSVANLEDVMGRHTRERDELGKSHMDQIKAMLARHSDEAAGLIGGTGAAEPAAKA